MPRATSSIALTEPTLPKPCTTAVLRSQADRFGRAHRQVHDAAPGGLPPAHGPARGDRLAGDDLGHRAPWCIE